MAEVAALEWKVEIKTINKPEELESTSTENQMNELECVTQSIYEDVKKFIGRITDASAGHLPNGEKEREINIDRGVNLAELLARLEHRIQPGSSSSPPDVYNHLSIVASCLKGYLTLLGGQRISHLADQVHQNTITWLLNLFGFDSLQGYFHHNPLDGLLKVCKLALLTKYPKYATDGFTTLYTRPPVVYISSAAPPNFGKEIRSQLGLPQSSICAVPCNTMFGSPYTMDVSAFERLLTDDVSCGKTPLVLIAYAGTPLTGHTDNLSRLREICTQSGVWFHVEGDTLAGLSLPNVPPSIKASTQADSVLLNLSDWFGMPALPSCTLYKANNSLMAELSGLVSSTSADQLTALPTWMVFQFLGKDDMQGILKHSAALAQQMCERLDAISAVKRIEQPTGVSPVVIFKYKAAPPLAVDDTDDDSPVKLKRPALAPKTSVSVTPQMCDTLNNMLASHSKSVVSKVAVEVVTVPREGACLKFNPLHTSRAHATCKHDIDEYVEVLQNKAVELDCSLVNRSMFKEMLVDVPDVTVVDVIEEPAIGAFQCIPRYWKTKSLLNLSDSKKQEVIDLNSTVFDELHEEFPNLSQIPLTNGLVSLQLAFAGESFSLDVFCEALTNVMEGMEDEEQLIESLGDAVQKSIEEAEERLKQEAEEKFLENGVLRNVPLVGSFYNWLSPPPKDGGVVGRSFDLSSGKLESTESIYKLKMQVDQSDTVSQISSSSRKSNRSHRKNQHSQGSVASEAPADAPINTTQDALNDTSDSVNASNASCENVAPQIAEDVNTPEVAIEVAETSELEDEPIGHSEENIETVGPSDESVEPSEPVTETVEPVGQSEEPAEPISQPDETVAPVGQPDETVAPVGQSEEIGEQALEEAKESTL